MKILAFAYACEPRRGSEPGAGWNWARMLSRLGDTWVITRSNNRPVVESELAGLVERQRLHFVYVDLPGWARFWKRGQRGVRLYYLLWQVFALRRARRLDREVGFDVVWHLTLANVWIGSLAALVGPTFVYGPVGGGIGIIWRLLPALGLRGAVYELLRGAIRGFARYANPFARLAWRRAALILVQSEETRRWLPRRHRRKAKVLPNAVIEETWRNRSDRRSGDRVALFAGRLLPFKGAFLALRAVAAAPGWRLRILGDGPDASRSHRLASRLQIEDRVHFMGWQGRDEVLRQMARSDLLLFPSLHDEAPAVVAEAVERGLPVVSLARGGAPLLAGESLVVPARGSLDQIVAAMAQRLSTPQVKLQHNPESLSINSRVRELAELLTDLLPGKVVDYQRF